MENERLIELVRMNRVLYDHTHPKYSDNHCKEATWKEIGKELNNSSEFPPHPECFLTESATCYLFFETLFTSFFQLFPSPFHTCQRKPAYSTKSDFTLKCLFRWKRGSLLSIVSDTLESSQACLTTQVLFPPKPSSHCVVL